MIVAIIIGIISILMDWYVFQAIKTLTENWENELYRKIIHWAFWVVFPAINIFVIYGILTLQDDRTMGPFTQYILSIFLILFITKFVIISVLFVEDIYRAFAGIFQKYINPTSENTVRFLPERRKFISQMGMILAAIPFTSFIYGMVKGKYDYRVHKQTIYFDDLPNNFDGFTITQISDIHAGSFDNSDAVQRGIDLIKEQKSDLFVFTGDIVNNIANELEPWINHFSQLRAPYGQFSILGNHDYGEYAEWKNEKEWGTNMETLKEHHATLGYRLLLDENINIKKEGQQITLLGVENWGLGFSQKGDLNKALEKVNEDSFKFCCHMILPTGVKL